MKIKEMKKDLLTVKVYETRDEMGKAAADEIEAEIRELLKIKETVNMIFAAAPSQLAMIGHLLKKEIEWNRINAFHMDEYIGLEKDAPQGFGNFLAKHLFEQAPFGSVHYINGQSEDSLAECERYSELLKENPVDITCLGIGENGHIAFNDPGVADFHDDTLVKVVELDEVCRQQQVNDGCFLKIETVPKTALTLTIPALVSAGAMFCVVPAASKEEAVYKTVEGAITEECPASVLRTHGHAVLYCDQDSGKKLIDEKKGCSKMHRPHKA